MQYTNNHKFKGKWITDRAFASYNKINVFHRYLDNVKVPKSEEQNAHILFRKSFDLNDFERAVIFISADDYYKLYVNGQFVNCGPAPGYYSAYNYNEIDITDYLVKGENEIFVHTYYQGLINRVWVSGDNLHGLILDLDIDNKTVISSDESFLCARDKRYSALGIIGYDTQFCECFDDSVKLAWENAVVNKNIEHNLVSQKTKMLEFEPIKPAEIIKTGYGYFVDFGKNYCGYLEFSANGKIEIRYGQELENNRIRYKMRANCKYVDKANINGKFKPFDYKAFRYAELICDTEVSDIKLIARHYPFEPAINTKMPNDKLQSVMDLCLHTLKYGIQEAPLDCPDREKGFYLGDACYIALTLGAITNDWSMLRKTVDDALETLQYSPSLLTCLNCSLIQEIAEFPLIMINSLAAYLDLTNDKDYISSIIDKVKSVFDYYSDNYTDNNGLISHTDKWCVCEWPDNFRDNYKADLGQNKELTDTHSIINAYYYSAMVSMNKLLGYDCYDTDRQKKAFLNAFYDADRKVVRDNINSSHSSRISNYFAYAFGLIDNCEIDISKVNIFTAFPVLQRLDKEQLIHQLENENAWLNMINEGTTTTFEAWGKEQKWNTSLFHTTLSYAAFFALSLTTY